MGFWDINPNEVKEEYVQEVGGNFDPIPHETNVMGFIDQIGWDNSRQDGARPVAYRICVAKPEIYKNRKLFLKFWLNGDNPQKHGEKQREEGKTASRKFYSIDKQFGGHLLALQREPTDEEMQRHLMNKMAVFKIGEYKISNPDGKTNSGNYLLGVCARGADVTEGAAPAKKVDPVANGTARYDDDIPF